MNRVLCSCLIWLVCASAVLPAAISSDTDSAAAQTPERSETQNVKSNAKNLVSGEKRSDETTNTEQKVGSLPMQKGSNSDFKFNSREENNQNPLHQSNNHPETSHQSNENHKSHSRDESPKLDQHQQLAQLAEPNSQHTPPTIPEHNREVQQPQQITAASSMHDHDQPRISEPASKADTQDWKTGLLNAVETNAQPKFDDEKSQVQSQSVVTDQSVKGSAESSKHPQSTATTALPGDHARNTEEIATPSAPSKDQNDDGEARTKPQSTLPVPSSEGATERLSSAKQPQPAAAAPSSSGHDTQTNV